MEQLISLKPLRQLIRRKLKPYAEGLLNQLGALDKEHTNAYLTPYQLAYIPENHVFLPAIKNSKDYKTTLFQEIHVCTPGNYVWRINKPSGNVVLLRCGGLLLKHKLLCTDYTTDAFINLLTRSKRTPYQAKTLIAPWSQYFEKTQTSHTYRRGISFRGYYDFMILVVAKICRIKDALPEHLFTQSVVAYPLLNTAYEQDVLALIGFRQDQILDSRFHKISFDTCLLGDSDDWCYPNVADVMSLKKHIEGRITIRYTDQNRIYVRRAGRRRIINEEALIELLLRYDFTIIEDVPRSIAEQVSIYRNADFILGPHGASFTNIIWCKPSAHLFELFNADYMPDCFLYLSQLLGLRYSAYCSGETVPNTKDALMADIIVSVSEVEKVLMKTLDSYSNIA